MAPALLLLFLRQSFYLLNDKRKVLTKEREVSSAEIQAEEDPVSLTLRPILNIFTLCAILHLPERG